MLRKRKLTSAQPKKLKLTPAQLEQTAAISEIEAILNFKHSSEEPLLKQQPRANGKQKAQLRSRLNKTAGKIQPAANSRQETGNSAGSALKKKINFLSVRQEAAHSPYTVNLKRMLEDREQDKSLPMQNWKKFPRLIKEFPAHKKEAMAAIKNYPRTTVTPWGIFLQGLGVIKSTGLASADYVGGFYNKHRAVLDELLIFNLLALAELTLARAFKLTDRLLIWLAQKIRRSKFSNKFISFGKNLLSSAGRAASFLFNKIGGAPQAAAAFFRSSRQSLAAAETAVKNKTTDIADDVAARQAKIIDRAADFWERLKLNLRSLKFLPPLAWQRQLIGFTLMAIALVLPLKLLGYFNVLQDARGRILGESEQAVNNLRAALQGTSELNFNLAANHFSSAADSFSQAQTTLSRYAGLIKVADILPGKQAKLIAAGQALISSGETAAKGGEYLALAVDSLQLGETAGIAPLSERLISFSQYSRRALAELKKFEREINDIDLKTIAAVDMAGKEQIAAALQQLQESKGAVINGLETITSLSEILPVFLGAEIDTRYLLIFQNNAEMRASGGFIGSFALVDFRQGEIKTIEVPGGGSYDLQGGLHKRFSSPEPLHLINSLWEFQDANWWPDWPLSAKKIAWFFANGWGSTVDGVIALDPTFFEELLAAIGPVDLQAEYGVTVDHDNFYDIVQAQAERKDTKKPKVIIRDLVDKIVTELPARLNADNLLSIGKVIEQALAEKHILLQFNDEELQKFALAQGWAGNIKDTASDYLAVINTNIAGGKSDRKIKQRVEHQASVTPDGAIIDTLTIIREHTGQKGEPFSGVRNVDYLRVYVPLGSQLLDASGFSVPDEIYFDPPAEGADIDPDIESAESTAKVDPQTGVKIYREFKKTVFAHWTQVDPGKSITIKFKYKLPFKLNNIKKSAGLLASILATEPNVSPYSLLAQKQPGSVTTDFTSGLRLPNNMEIVWARPAEADVNKDGWQVQSDLRQDGFWAALIDNQ